MAAYPRDIFVYRYGKRWAWRFETGRAKEIFVNKEAAIAAARAYKKLYNDRTIYVQTRLGTFEELKEE